MNKQTFYYVIKDCDNLKKGWQLTQDPNVEDFYTYTDTHETDGVMYEETVTLNKCMCEELVKKGVLSHGSTIEDKPACECKCAKVENIIKKIDDLQATYSKDFDNLMAEYNEGNVPQCVKVEAETVYFNIDKVLGQVKAWLNE